MEELFQSCGYLASFLGTLIEGDILLLTSVMSAKLGYFNYFGGMMAAFMGGFVRDSIQFLLAKKYGTKLLAGKPKLQAKLDSTSVWFEKHPNFYMTFYRILYGFTTPILLLLGLKDISYGKFAMHSAVSVLIWISIVGGLGYFFAEKMIESLNFMKAHSSEVIGVMAVAGLAYWFFVKRPFETHCFKPHKEVNL